jgi:NADH dehydrogenase
MNIEATNLKRLVIIGGGFAGLSLAKNLRKAPLQIVLIDRNNYHTFQPLLYQVSTGGLEPDSIAYPIRKTLKRLQNFHFRWAEVERVDPEGKVVHTSIGALSYDYLVLAMGTRTNFFGNKGIQENAMPMKNVPQALNIRSLMLQNFEMADDCESAAERMSLMNISIIGAGPTGVELAGAFAELKRHVFPKDYRHLNIAEMEIHLYEGSDRVLAGMSEHASEKAHSFLDSLGVTIHLHTLVQGYDGELLTMDNGDTVQTRNCIWTAGVTGASLDGFKNEGVLDKGNRYTVNPYSQVQGYESVFAIGDVAKMVIGEYAKGHPQVAQPAIQQGEHLAENLQRHLSGKPMKPFHYRDKGTMATIGRNKAVVDLHKIHFAGFFAWFIWMFIHLMFLVGFRNKMVVFLNWTYNYINYDKAARLIVRPFRKIH